MLDERASQLITLIGEPRIGINHEGKDRMRERVIRRGIFVLVRIGQQTKPRQGLPYRHHVHAGISIFKLLKCPAGAEK